MSKLPQMLVCIGDSITQGSGSTTIAWPYALRKLCGHGFAAAQYGVGGYVASQMVTNWSTNIRTSLATTKFASSPKRFLFLLGGINDCIASTAAATTYATLKGIIDNAVADNVSVANTWTHIWWLNTTPCGPADTGGSTGYSGLTAAKLAIQQTLNASIMGYSAANVTSIDAYTLLGDNSDATKLSRSTAGGKADYATPDPSGSADWLHPNNAGDLAIATSLFTSMRSLGYV